MLQASAIMLIEVITATTDLGELNSKRVFPAEKRHTPTQTTVLNPLTRRYTKTKKETSRQLTILTITLRIRLL